ncbi:hypothetical protein BUALT_Bualt02G0162800 [Buddleja alternifolia]|uniref:Uncharacterized protein n=1 Tax=Buddleja alternifolia TaxID=168488 RepID=A0AAV6YBS0_9LAMI|nr:hypothetical protein BUALT_Bualt02G0162800 [Buddleja alternifolia]
MLLAYICIILCFQLAIAQSSRDLDSLLQNYAFRAFVRPRTGVVYDGHVPSNFTGIQVAALRLRSGSLRRRGFDSYKEFHVPVGVVEQPYVERVVLVYHNLGNFSNLYYPLPGYTFLAPVLGLLAYDATDLSATNLSELDVRASAEPISVNFSNVRFRANGSSMSTPMCVYFGLDGSVGFDNVVNESTCLTTNQGHFSIVVGSLVAPAPTPSGGRGGTTGIGGGNGRSKRASEKDATNGRCRGMGRTTADDTHWEHEGARGVGDSD